MFTRKLRRGALIGFMMVSVVLAGCGSTDEGAGDLRDVKLGVATRVIEPSMFQAYLAGALGYWEEEGLDVEALTFQESTEMLQANLAGKTDVSYGASAPVLNAIQKGQGLLSVFNNYSSNIYTIAVPEESDIQTLSDLDGLRLGVASNNAGNIPLIKAMLAGAGVSDGAVELVPVGVGQEALAFLEKDRVDAFGLWDAQYTIFKRLGQATRVLESPVNESAAFIHVISTTSEHVENEADREALVGLLRGVAKARLFAVTNPEAAAKLYYKTFPENKPSGKSLDDAVSDAAEELEERLKYTEETDGLAGNATDEQIQAYVQILLDTGTLEQELAPDEAFDNEFLEDANDFDAEAIKEEARNFSG